MRDKFAPEFLNRFTGIITFRPLTPEDVAKITLILLAKVTKNLEAKSIKVVFSDELVQKLAKDGFDSQWGARPLRRLIESTVESYLAKKLLPYSAFETLAGASCVPPRPAKSIVGTVQSF